LAEENEIIDSRELEYCIRESLDNLHLGGVFTSFNSSCSGAFNVKYIVAAYDFYEVLVERLLKDITAMMIHLRSENGQIKMNVQMGCREDIAAQVLSDIHIPFGEFSYEVEDEDVVINLTLLTGGEAE
jgi:hypothetical protein